MRIVPIEKDAECVECSLEADLAIEFESSEEPVAICRTCVVVMRWHIEHIEEE